MKKILYILLALFTLVGCKESEIPFFDDTRFIRFSYDDANDDDYNMVYYSFAIYGSEVKEHTFKLPLTYAGRELTSDLEYSVEFDAEKTTMSSSDYSIVGSTTFSAESATDFLEVKVSRLAGQKTLADSVVVTLVSNDNFEASTVGSLSYTLVISDLLNRPNWWNSNIEEAYLGEYSDKKYVEFAKIIGDIDYGALSADEQRYYAQLFKIELAQNPIYEDDGSLMTVTVV